MGYNRPHLLEQVLHAINSEVDVSGVPIFLSLDGPKGKLDSAKVVSSRTLFDNFSKGCESVSKYYSLSNLGLRAKVVDSVTRAFDTVENLLVIEDDCIIGPSTIDFFNWGLGVMRSDNQVEAVSGNYLGPKFSHGAFRARRFSSWGWATNKKNWNNFLESEQFQLELGKQELQIKKLTRNSPLPYFVEYRRIIKFLPALDSWAIPFDMYVRSRNGVVLKPTVSQVQNIGFGPESTHTQNGALLAQPTGYLDVSKVVLAGKMCSRGIELLEAWSKNLRMAQSFLGESGSPQNTSSG